MVTTSTTSGAAIVGIGQTPIFKRLGSAPLTEEEMTGLALIDACEDAGIPFTDIDGFAFYRGGVDAAYLAQTMGIPEVRFSASISGAGGASAGAVGLAAAAIAAGHASVVACPMAFQQRTKFGAAYAKDGVKGGPLYSEDNGGDYDFIQPPGLVAPAQMFALMARRHMHKFGTTREHFAEVVISARANASTNPRAHMREPLTRDDYFASRMISEPICLLDCCLETEGAAVVIVTSEERAKDLRGSGVRVRASLHGGTGDWGQGIMWLNMPDDIFTSAGHRPIAQRLWQQTGLRPDDVDVALLYDHFSPMVLMQLEDYGFCPPGESGPFVADGNIRLSGSLPVNPMGGQLSEGYLLGMTQILEGVRQLRGTATNQVPGAHIALVTGGPAALPTSGMILEAM